MFRYVRYAAAGFFVLLAIALIGLWVRSSCRADELAARIAGPIFGCSSSRGIAKFFWAHSTMIAEFKKWHYHSFEPSNWWRYTTWGFGFASRANGKHYSLYLPHWFLAACSFGLAALFAFKLRWRF